MPYAKRLTDVLAWHLPWYRARLKFIARFTTALMKLTTTNLALALKATVKPASSYRRFQRFMADFPFDFEGFGRFLPGLLPQRSGYVVIIDRTEWHVGQAPVNVLMIGVAYQGIALPIVWETVGQEGSSSAEEGKALFERFLRLAGPDQIRAVVGDQEFIGEKWLAFLAAREIPFVIPAAQASPSGAGQP